MPGFDGTGPRGTGPMTGRGLGYCVESIGSNSKYRGQDMPYGDTYAMHQRPLGPLSYSFRPYGFFNGGGRGWRSGARGRSFGRGRGFGRRWI